MTIRFNRANNSYLFIRQFCYFIICRISNCIIKPYSWCIIIYCFTSLVNSVPIYTYTISRILSV